MVDCGNANRHRCEAVKNTIGAQLRDRMRQTHALVIPGAVDDRLSEK